MCWTGSKFGLTNYGLISCYKLLTPPSLHPQINLCWEERVGQGWRATNTTCHQPQNKNFLSTLTVGPGKSKEFCERVQTPLSVVHLQIVGCSYFTRIWQKGDGNTISSQYHQYIYCLKYFKLFSWQKFFLQICLIWFLRSKRRAHTAVMKVLHIIWLYQQWKLRAQNSPARREIFYKIMEVNVADYSPWRKIYFYDVWALGISWNRISVVEVK